MKIQLARKSAGISEVAGDLVGQSGEMREPVKVGGLETGFGQERARLGVTGDSGGRRTGGFCRASAAIGFLERRQQVAHQFLARRVELVTALDAGDGELLADDEVGVLEGLQQGFARVDRRRGAGLVARLERRHDVGNAKLVHELERPRRALRRGLPDLLAQGLAQALLRARHVIEHGADHRQRVCARHGRVDGRHVLAAVAHRLHTVQRDRRDEPGDDQADGSGLQALRLR